MQRNRRKVHLWKEAMVKDSTTRTKKLLYLGLIRLNYFTFYYKISIELLMEQQCKEDSRYFKL